MQNQGQAVATETESFSFKCGDGGHAGCEWAITANNEDLLIFQIEIHAQNVHNLVIDEGGKEKIRACIKRNPATAS